MAKLLHYNASFSKLMEMMTKDTPSSYVTVHRLKDAVAPLGNSLSAMINIQANPDPTRMPAYHQKKLVDTGKKLEQFRQDTFDNAQGVLRDGLRTLQGRINQKVRLVPNENAAEIRAVFRNMDPKTRMETLADLARNNKADVLAAITEVPAILTGVSEEHQKRFRELTIELHAPEEWAEQKALMEAFDVVLAATDVAKNAAMEACDTTGLADVARAEKAAADAEAAFNSSAVVAS